MQDLLQHGSPRLSDLLDAALFRQVTALGKLVSYSDEQQVHARGDAKPGISIVESGAVSVGTVGIDGSFGTASIMGPGQCFGEFTLFAGLPRTHDISAIGETRIHQIPARAFMQLCDREPAITRALLTIALLRSHGLLDFIDDMRRLPLAVRVAKTLLSMSESARNPNEIRCRQEDLAYTFGHSRVSIGKVLKELERYGLITLGYGWIGIEELERLRDWVSARAVVTPLRAKLDNSK